MQFVAKEGTWDIDVTNSSRAGTPLLSMSNLTTGNVVKLTCTFFGITGSSGGFYFSIASTNGQVAQALTPASGVFSNSPGWQSLTLTALFQITAANTPVVDVDFEVLFSKVDLNGKGKLHNFLLTANVVSIDVP